MNTIKINQLFSRAQKEAFKNLLLEADPCWEVVCKYLEGDMYVLLYHEIPVAEAVILFRKDFAMYELKNIAVISKFRSKGLAKTLITRLQALYHSKSATMCVGTCTLSKSAQQLYLSCGFSLWFIEKDFFVKNYPLPIFEENGEQCIDMIYMQCNL